MSIIARIGVHGCDDSTIVDLGLSDEELQFLKRLARTVNAASSYNCMPTIDIKINGKEVDYADA